MYFSAITMMHSFQVPIVSKLVISVMKCLLLLKMLMARLVDSQDSTSNCINCGARNRS